MASFLSGLLGLDAGKATSKAATQNKGLLAGLMDRGQGVINTGEQQSAAYLGSAAQQQSPWQNTGQGANELVGNALGLNGTGGNATAAAAFQAGPGYGFAQDAMQQATERGASAGGQLASGNLLTALQDRSAGIANQEYGGWLDRLMGVSRQGQAAAAGTAGALTNLGGLYQGTADDRLGLDASVTQGYMGANNQFAQGKEANAAGMAGLGSSIGGLAGKFLGFL